MNLAVFLLMLSEVRPPMLSLTLTPILDAKPEESAIPEHPEMAVFATFTNVAKYPSKISALGEMADTSERLRQVSIKCSNVHTAFDGLTSFLIAITQTSSYCQSQ